jgi:hypothetical protein
LGASPTASAYPTRPVDDWQLRNEVIVEALMIAFVVIVRDELGRRKCCSPIGIVQWRHSSLIERTNRSACAGRRLVQAADSLGFLDTNIDLFLGLVRSGRFSVAQARDKIQRCVHADPRSSSAHARGAAAATASARLTALEADLRFANRG